MSARMVMKVDGPSSQETCDGHVAGSPRLADMTTAWRGVSGGLLPAGAWFESIKESGTWANSALSR